MCNQLAFCIAEVHRGHLLAFAVSLFEMLHIGVDRVFDGLGCRLGAEYTLANLAFDLDTPRVRRGLLGVLLFVSVAFLVGICKNQASRFSPCR